MPLTMLTLSNKPIQPKMNKFTAPADKLVHETTGYINAQLDDVKLRSIKGLSQGTSALASFLLIFIIVGAFVTALSFALVLWLGEALNSYALACLITAGVLLVVLAVFFLLRKQLFKNSFVAMYTDIFFPNENKPVGLKTQEGLDLAIKNAEIHIKDQEEDISYAFNQCKDFYSIRHIVGEGIPAAVHSLFRKKETKKK